MKLNKLSLSLAITLALGSTFSMAHAETTATHIKSEVSNVATRAEVSAKADEHRVDTSVKNDTKRRHSCGRAGRHPFRRRAAAHRRGAGIFARCTLFAAGRAYLQS